jgi:hypothetical protein
MRTLTGAEHFCHLRSYLATATKHGINLYDALIQLASGQPWIPQSADLSSYDPGRAHWIRSTMLFLCLSSCEP